MAPKIVYITGFRQHAGKTVTSLGLISLLKKFYKPGEIGYIKPVGQELVELEDGSKVDKDAQIIKIFAGIPDIDMKLVSPVRLGSGFTKKFLNSSSSGVETAELARNIVESIQSLAHKKIIIAEGTGHPGVGGIVNLSNANVSNLMGADTVYLSGGGIGKALDMLEVDLTYFLHFKCNIRGIIFNKLFPDKLDQVKDFITEDLINRRYAEFGHKLYIYGYLPEIEMLYKPSMRVLLEKFSGAEVFGEIHAPQWKRPGRAVRVISVTNEYLRPEKYLHASDLVIIGAGSSVRIERVLDFDRDSLETSGEGLAGLIITCGDTVPLDDDIRKRIARSSTPCLFVQDDTAVVETKIQEAFENTKLQIYDEDKVHLVEKLFAEFFDIDKFASTLGIR